MNDKLAKAEPEQTALARAEDFLGVSVELLTKRVDKIREVRDHVMKLDAHYGKIPGVDKPTLLKPGAEVLCMAFQLAPDLDVTEHRDGEHLEVVIKCTLIHTPTGAVVGSGIGSCSTRESKYAWRKSERVCPDCGSPALLKSKHDPEWFCWAKRGGCGAKFELQDERITKQVTGRVPNPDLADQYNTVRKMAAKRAHVAATLSVTGASELFTQDVEDMPRAQPDEQAANGNGRTRNGNGSKPKPVASDEEVTRLLQMLRTAASVPELESIRESARVLKFNATQSKKLSEAAKLRRAQLEDPDFEDEHTRNGPGNNADADGEF